MITKETLENLFFPKNLTCLHCGCEINHNHSHSLCLKCFSNLPFNTHFCIHCGTPMHSKNELCEFCQTQNRGFLIARSPFCFESPISNFVHGFKYENKQFLFKHMAAFMYAEFLKSKMQADIVIPVPLSNQRLKQRKYNQATKLAQEFCKLSKIPLYENLVLRYQNTHTQTDLSWQQRQENLKNAFKICNKTQQIVNNKKILIVDDVFTTGATTSNLAMLLQSGGAKQVSILTLAHTDFKNK